MSSGQGGGGGAGAGAGGGGGGSVAGRAHVDCKSTSAPRAPMRQVRGCFWARASNTATLLVCPEGAGREAHSGSIDGGGADARGSVAGLLLGVSSDVHGAALCHGGLWLSPCLQRSRPETARVARRHRM